MAQQCLPKLTYVLILLLTIYSSEVNPESYSSTNFEDKLGIAYEFKIHIDAGREDCFYQNIQHSSSLYVAFQVFITLLNFLLLKFKVYTFGVSKLFLFITNWF
jgi:hypothetical protein